MDVTLPCPDHTTLSRRNTTVAIRQQVERAPQGPISLIVDGSGLQVCGQGEWHAQKHGEKKHKRWKKLHLGVDDHGQLVTSTRGTTRRVMRRMPFSASSRSSAADYGRSGMRLRNGKPRWRVSCSIGCGSWGVRSPFPSA